MDPPMSIGLDGLGRLAYVLKREGDRSQDLQRTPPMDSKPSAFPPNIQAHDPAKPYLLMG